MSKKKIATFWLAGCSGCHMSLLDMDERILEVARLADIVKSPIVDGKELPEVEVAIVEGAVSLDEHWEEIRHIRKHCKVLVALGDCAGTGNIPTYRNYFPKEAALRRAYVEAESNENGAVPRDAEVSKLMDRVRPLHEVVPVDYFINGCPPSADAIFYVLNELLNDRVPVLEKGKLKYG